MEPLPEITVELNRVLVHMGIRHIKRLLPTGVAQAGRYTRSDLERHVRTIREKQGAAFDEQAFEDAYAKAEASQRKSDEQAVDRVVEYAEAEKDAPPTGRFASDDERSAYLSFLGTRTKVIQKLTGGVDTVVAFVDAGDNARLLAEYLGGLDVVRIDRTTTAVDPMYPNVILYGHMTYETAFGRHGIDAQPDLGKPRLGVHEKLSPAHLADVLGSDRTLVAVLGCESDVFAAELDERLAGPGVLQTTRPFRWKHFRPGPSFVHAFDSVDGTSYGTLADILSEVRRRTS